MIRPPLFQYPVRPFGHGVDPYIADPPEDDEPYCDCPTELVMGEASGFYEFSAAFMRSAEYKRMRREAKQRGKLGF